MDESAPIMVVEVVSKDDPTDIVFVLCYEIELEEVKKHVDSFCTIKIKSIRDLSKVLNCEGFGLAFYHPKEHLELINTRLREKAE